MPLVTVIIPAFQAAATLKRAVDSVCSQDFSDFEVLIVNDGSSDATGQIADACASENPNVRAIHLPRNEGAAVAMNTAWQQCDSRFIAIQDADDTSMPYRLRTQVDYLESLPSISVLGGGAYFVEPESGFRKTVWMPSNHRDLRRRRWYQSPFVHPTVMMRREFLSLTGGYTPGLRLGEDYDLWMRGFLHPQVRYANLSLVLVEYTTRAVQRWEMIRASAQVRRMAGKREGRVVRGLAAATRILAEGAVERSGVFALRDQITKVAKNVARGPKRAGGSL